MQLSARFSLDIPCPPCQSIMRLIVGRYLHELSVDIYINRQTEDFLHKINQTLNQVNTLFCGLCLRCLACSQIRIHYTIPGCIPTVN